MPVPYPAVLYGNGRGGGLEGLYAAVPGMIARGVVRRARRAVPT